MFLLIKIMKEMKLPLIFLREGDVKKNDSEVEVFVIYCRGKSYF